MLAVSASPAKQQREMRSAFDSSSGISDAERDRLGFFAHDNGHCSACATTHVRTAHLGIKGKANVGLCKACIDALVKAMAEGPDVT